MYKVRKRKQKRNNHMPAVGGRRGAGSCKDVEEGREMERDGGRWYLLQGTVSGLTGAVTGG